MINKEQLDDLEQQALKIDNIYDRNLTLDLLIEIRSLQHQLNDPNYLYCETRIHRQTILSREIEIEKLQKEIKDLKNQVPLYNQASQPNETQQQKDKECNVFKISKFIFDKPITLKENETLEVSCTIKSK